MSTAVSPQLPHTARHLTAITETVKLSSELSGLEKHEASLRSQVSEVSGVGWSRSSSPPHRYCLDGFEILNILVPDQMVVFDGNAFTMESILNGKQRNICKKDYFT